MPSTTSIHQDHMVISQEGLRAFKHVRCLGYDLPWDNSQFQTNFFYKLEERHINKKYQAVSCYKTQGFRVYTSREMIYGLATVRGAQASHAYAEAFEAIRYSV